MGLLRQRVGITIGSGGRGMNVSGVVGLIVLNVAGIGARNAELRCGSRAVVGHVRRGER